jgi:cell division protein FtsZ
MEERAKKKENPEKAENKKEEFQLKYPKDTTNQEIEPDENNQRTIEFEMTKNYEEEFVVKDVSGVENTHTSPQNQERSHERLKMIKQSQLNFKEFGYNQKDDKNNIEELENQPAYMRRNIKIDQNKQSDDEEISRYTLSEDDDLNVRFSDDNPYLHDNVD